MSTNFGSSSLRLTAGKQKLAVKHQLGSVGFIRYNNRYDAEVYFPNWNNTGKPKLQTYGDTTDMVSIVEPYISYDEYIKTSKQKEQTMSLFEVTKADGTKVFATKMAEKSKTLWVMEIKGTGEFVAVSTDSIQEVLPYTIAIRNLSGGNTNSFEVPEGKFEKGDVLVLASGDIGVVTMLNSKVKGVPELKPIAKLVSAPV